MGSIDVAGELVGLAGHAALPVQGRLCVGRAVILLGGIRTGTGPGRTCKPQESSPRTARSHPGSIRAPSGHPGAACRHAGSRWTGTRGCRPRAVDLGMGRVEFTAPGRFAPLRSSEGPDVGPAADMPDPPTTPRPATRAGRSRPPIEPCTRGGVSMRSRGRLHPYGPIHLGPSDAGERPGRYGIVTGPRGSLSARPAHVPRAGRVVFRRPDCSFGRVISAGQSDLLPRCTGQRNACGGSRRGRGPSHCGGHGN